MKRQASILVILFLTITGYSQTYNQDFIGKVVNVIDGNTLEIENENDEIITLMLSDVDCPELGQPLGDKAKEFTEDLLLKKKVTVEMKGKDWLGNKLAVITHKNGTVLHDELIKNGLAWASKKASEATASLESSAKENKIGLWEEKEPTPPWIYRRQQTMMQAKSR